MARTARIARIISPLLFGCTLALLGLGCSGGGETAVIGFANHGNTLGAGGIAEELAESLSESEATPRVTDEMIAQVFDAILKHARDGDPEAALIVLKLAEEQREAQEG